MDSSPKVAPSFSSVERKLRNTFDALEEIALLIGERGNTPVILDTRPFEPGMNLLSDARNILVRLEELRKGIFTVLVIGTFKNGKSTLLNALMGVSTLPMRGIPCTAVISVLVHGTTDTVKIVQNTEPTTVSMPWKQFDETYRLTREDQQRMEQGEVLDRFAQVEYAEIPRSHHLLATGVRLVDSPGLGEHILRTRAAMDFLSQSHAVIVALDATKILSQDERFFIEEFLGKGRLNHVFFVVNKINLVEQNSMQEAQEIREWVHDYLRHHFLDDRGEFDEEFYHRRVFFLNARAALDARTADPTNEQLLEHSGMLPFESELEHFLTSDEKFAAALQSTSEALRQIVIKVVGRAERTAVALQQPLELLRAQQARVEAQLQSVEREKRTIDRTVDLTAEKVKNKIYDDLILYFQELEGSWGEDSKQLDWQHTISLGGILKGMLSSKALEGKIRQEITKYISAKMRQWSQDRLPALVAPEMQLLEADVQRLLEDYSIQLSQLNEAFAHPDFIANMNPGTDKRKGSRMIQGAVGVLLLDPSQVTAAALGTGEWSNFIARAVVDGVIYGVLFAMFGPFGIALYLVGEIIHIIMQREHLRERIVKTVGTNLFASIKKALPLQRGQIFSEIEQQFKHISDALTTSVQQQIDDVRHEMVDIIREKERQDADTSQEVDRQMTIRDRVLERYNEVLRITNQATVTVDDFREPPETTNRIGNLLFPD